MALLFLAALLTAAACQNLHPIRESRVGQYELPNLDPETLPIAACNEWSEACSAEAEGRYSDAFRIYESKYSTCGDYGWVVIGRGEGLDKNVMYKRSPCGLRVAIKSANTPKECMRLKQLTTGTSAFECYGCFPKYYWYSPMTTACYSELIDGVDRNSVLPGTRAFTQDDVLNIQSLFLQGVAAVRTMRKHNIEHHDLVMANLMIRRASVEVSQRNFDLVVIDLAQSVPLGDMERRLRGLSSESHWSSLQGDNTDLYALACSFMAQLYRDAHGARDTTCMRTLPELPTDASSFKHALVQVMHANANHHQVPDYAQIAAWIHAATRR